MPDDTPLNDLGPSTSDTPNFFKGLDSGSAIALGTMIFVTVGFTVWAACLRYKEHRLQRFEKAEQQDLERQVSNDSITRPLSVGGSISGETLYGSQAPSRAQIEKRWWQSVAKCGDTKMADLAKIQVPGRIVQRSGLDECVMCQRCGNLLYQMGSCKVSFE